MNKVGKALNHILQNGTTLLSASPDFAKVDYSDNYITYRISGNSPSDTKNGPSDLDEIDVDITIFSKDSETLLELAEKVRNDLDRAGYGQYNGVGLGGVQFQGEDSDYNDMTERYEHEQRYIFRVSTNITHSPPGGSCDPATVSNSDDSFSASIASGSSLVLSDNTVTDVDGTTRTAPAQTDVVCAWATFKLFNSAGTTIYQFNSYPTTAIVISDITKTEVNGSTSSVPAGVDVVCSWTSLTVVNSLDTVLASVGSFPSGGEIEISDVTHTDSDGTSVVKAAGVAMVCTPAASVPASPCLIPHRRPTYTDSAGDYATLFNAGYFSVYQPTGSITPSRLGANDFILDSSTPNVFGSTARYTSTDGTASDTGTARFSSGYGSGVSGLVIDHHTWIMWKNTPESGANNWNSAQTKIDALNTASLGGYSSGWIRPTRDMYIISAMPESNEEIHTSPNLIVDSGSRRYLTCEAVEVSGSQFGFFAFFTGTEAYQSKTTTAGSQTYTVACRIMTLAELEALT